MVQVYVKCPKCKKWMIPSSRWMKFSGSFDDIFRLSIDSETGLYKTIIETVWNGEHYVSLENAEIQCYKCKKYSKVSEYKTKIVYSDNDIWMKRKNVIYAECCENCEYFNKSGNYYYCSIEDPDKNDDTMGEISPGYICDEFDPKYEGDVI